MSQGAFWLFKSPGDVARFGPGLLAAIERLLEGGWQTVKVQGYTDPRSLRQNAIQHVWYSEIEKAGVESSQDARRYCKLHIGVPIMRGGETDASVRFRQAWDKLAKARFSYEEKLEVMDWWPVTSLMDHDQMSVFLDRVQQHYAGQGIILESR